MALIMSKNLRDAMERNKLAEKKVVMDDLEGIKKYVKEHTSGVKEHYNLSEGGIMVVSFPRFVEMIEEGYNIYKSEVLNKDYINIAYQKEIKRESRGR